MNNFRGELSNISAKKSSLVIGAACLGEDPKLRGSHDTLLIYNCVLFIDIAQED